MKTIITSLFLALSVVAIGQFPRNTGHLPIKHDTIPTGPVQLSILSIPAYPAVDSNATFIAPGQVFKTVITNNSSHSVSLYPYLNRVGMEQIAWGDSFLLAYLRSQIVGLADTDDIRLRLVQVLATKIEKTDIFNHGQVLYNACTDSALYAKQNSLMGAMETLQKQCSDYEQNGIAILIETGFFNASNIQEVYLVNHVACQFLYRGAWVFADLDPQEPFFMIADSMNENGFASATDIYNNHSLITENQRYYFVNDAGDSLNISNPSINVVHYQNRFAALNISAIPFTAAPISLSGIITLPASASLIAEYTGIYVLDSASLAAIRSIPTSNADSIYSTIAEELGVSKDSAMAIISENKLSLGYTTKTWQPDYRGITPTLKIILPPTKDTINIGKGLNFCGYVLSSSANVALLDSSFSVNESPKIWTSGNNNAISGQTVSDGSIQYLSGGGFIPPHNNSSDTLVVSFNPMIVNFAMGLNVGYSTGDSINASVFLNDSLSSMAASPPTNNHNNIRNITPLLTKEPLLSGRTTIRTHHHSNESDSITNELTAITNTDANLYPNPASDRLHIISVTGATASLFNMSGELIQQIRLSEENTMGLERVESGIYVCRIADASGLIIYTKEIAVIH